MAPANNLGGQKWRIVLMMDQPTAPNPPEPLEEQQPVDAAGLLGLLVGSAAVICTLLGFLIPFIFWILSGVLGLVTLTLGVFANPPLRRWVLIAGGLSMIPVILLLLVQSLPTIQ